MKPSPPQEIFCTQILQADASVYSSQWMVLPAHLAQGMTAEEMLARYCRHIRRFTCSLVRPAICAGGVEFRVLGSSLCLLAFVGPHCEESQAASRLSLDIRGGLLVQSSQRGRGSLVLSVAPHPDGVRFSLELADYFPLLLGSTKPPLLRKRLYRMTQASIHKLATVRFLAGLYRELAGHAQLPTRVVKVATEKGEDI